MATPPHQVSPEEQQQLKLFSDLVPGILVWWKTSSRGPHRKEDPPLVFLNGTVHPLSKHFGPRRLPTTPVSSLSVVLQQRRHDAAHTMRPQRGICRCSGRCMTVLCLCRRQEDGNTKIFGSGMRQDNDQGKPPILVLLTTGKLLKCRCMFSYRKPLWKGHRISNVHRIHRFRYEL
jgi:hypothetical protein